jgi:ABC-type multidrug transport system ATPase subunit
MPDNEQTASVCVSPSNFPVGKESVPATITWNKLTVVAKDSKGHVKELLKGVSGFLEPSRMLAIMGPSGCGKTTLLDTLSGRQASSVDVSGQVSAL